MRGGYSGFAWLHARYNACRNRGPGSCAVCSVARCDWRKRQLRVTSYPTAMNGIPEFTTVDAASGSSRMLCSGNWRVGQPPMNTSRSMFPRNRG